MMVIAFLVHGIVGGVGKKYGFHIQEIMLVSHGGWHNDTIVVVDKKAPQGKLF